MKRDMPVSLFDVPSLMLLFFLILGVGLAVGMVGPYLDSIVIAGILAIIMNPVYRRLLALLGGHRSLAAFMTSLLLTVLVVIPCLLLVWQLLRETAGLYQALMQWTNSDAFQDFMKEPKVVRIITALNRYLAEFKGLTTGSPGQPIQKSQLAIQIATEMAKRVLDHGSYIVEHAASLFGNFLLMIFAFFFMIRDQERLQRGIFRLLPFTRGHEDDIRQQVVIISRSAILGIFLTAIAQGIGAAIGFWVTGIPVLFGSVATALASFIPLIGTGVIWLPATMYLLFTHNVGYAIFLSIWWAVVVVFVLDNILRPFLMSGGAAISTPLVFFFILGGIHYFGLAGVLYGPLILGALSILLYLYDLTMSTGGIKITGEGRIE